MGIYNKYRIEHADGTPLKGKRYFVLRLDSDDPIEAARVNAAMRAYDRKPRNCDVGTADEQEKRFEKFCNSNYNPNDVDAECWGCPLMETGNGCRCEFDWAQMPYDKGGVVA